MEYCLSIIIFQLFLNPNPAWIFCWQGQPGGAYGKYNSSYDRKTVGSEVHLPSGRIRVYIAVNAVYIFKEIYLLQCNLFHLNYLNKLKPNLDY